MQIKTKIHFEALVPGFFGDSGVKNQSHIEYQLHFSKTQEPTSKNLMIKFAYIKN